MKRMPKRAALAIALVGLCLGWGTVRWTNATSQPAIVSDFSKVNLADCPDSPNCVCTSATQPQHQIEPIKVAQGDQAPMAKLKSIVEEMPGSRITEAGNEFLRAEFRSTVFGFVDDLELKLDETKQLVLVRSASRVGYSDLGVNRKRVEEIRRRYSGQ